MSSITEWFKSKLVPEAAQWYKTFTVKGLAFIGAVQGVMVVLPQRYLDTPLPFTHTSVASLGLGLTIAAAVLTGVGRFVDQKIPTE